MQTFTIDLPETIDPHEARMVIAAALFDRELLSSGQAAAWVGISRRQFLEEVGKYGVSIFGETAEDLAQVKHLSL